MFDMSENCFGDGRAIAERAQKLSTVRKKRGRGARTQNIRKTRSCNSRPIHRMLVKRMDACRFGWPCLRIIQALYYSEKVPMNIYIFCAIEDGNTNVSCHTHTRIIFYIFPCHPHENTI